MKLLDKLMIKIFKLDIIKYYRKQGMQIGNGCEIYETANFGSEPYLITLGNKVRITEGVKFVTHDGGVWVLRNLTHIDNQDIEKIDYFGCITIGDNVHIGMNAIIMPGVHIGSNCIIGCGAVVTKNIEDNSIAVGVPARVIKTIDEYYDQHISEFDYTKKLTLDEKKIYLHNKYQR